MAQIKDDGERMIPAYHSGTLIYAEHISRYRFAAQFVAGKRVLDVASGTGYGSELLKQAGASEVIGVDYARDAVAYSLSEHCGGHPDYVLGDAVRLPLADRSFDVVVSFETLEHVPEPNHMLAELRRVLKEDGLSVISTPNKGVYLEGNPFHTHELTYEEFLQSLSAGFKHVQVLSQENWLASALFDAETMTGKGIRLNGGTDLYKTVPREPRESVYMVALASNAPLPKVSLQLTLTTPAEVEGYVRALDEAKAEIARRDAEAKEEIAHLKEEIARLQKQIDEQNRTLERQDTMLRDQDDALAERQQVIDDLTHQLIAIHGSMGYRLIKRYRRMTNWLFPPGSVRGIPYRAGVKTVRAAAKAPRRVMRTAQRGTRARNRYGTVGVVNKGIQSLRAPRSGIADPLKYALAIPWDGTPSPGRPRQRREGEPIVVNWLVPTVGEGGGLRTIFRFYEHLEEQGFKQRLYEMPIGRPRRAKEDELRQEAKRLFGVDLKEVGLDFDHMQDADIVLASSWHTAYPVLKHSGAGRKFYFVQDFEPYFSALGTEAVLAENTYRFGFTGLTAGRWLAQKLSAEYGMTCHPFNLAADPAIYFPKPYRQHNKIFYYARPATPRRGFELGMQALDVFHSRHPEYEIVLAGGEIPQGSWKFPFNNRGYLSEDRLNDLYNQCGAALVISLTNCSLLPLEIMSAGCPVVTNVGANNELALPPDSAIYAIPSPSQLADALEQAIKIEDRDGLVTLARQYSWEEQFATVERILLEAAGAKSPA
jgi:2-polyprenyl-3-methyl-5-hydroxy-6-metoxy-1,4-benzoquinol methylase/glycosyltransferase involved in cell wall biosynthesis